MRAAAVIVALLIGLALTSAVAWNTAESHYRGCIAAASAIPAERGKLDVFDAELANAHRRAVAERVRGCSRWP